MRKGKSSIGDRVFRQCSISYRFLSAIVGMGTGGSKTLIVDQVLRSPNSVDPPIPKPGVRSLGFQVFPLGGTLCLTSAIDVCKLSRSRTDERNS